MEGFKNDHKLSYLKVDEPPDSAPSSPRPLSPLTPDEQAVLQNRSDFWGAGWTWEIVSCVIAAGSLVAIIVVLHKFDGRATPDWPYGITLNALISVLVTVMKAAMAFPITEALSQLKWSWFNEDNKLSDLALLDAASRGAVGALVVLFRFLPRHLVSIGCFIIVVGAAIAPFVQQVVSIETRSIHSPRDSTIRICNGTEYVDYAEGAGPGMNKAPLSTTGAIYTGIFESQSPMSHTTTVNCPTGNCTYTTYQSLGFCSRCANITDQLDLNVTSMYPGSSSSLSSMTSNTYDYTLPNGWNFTTSYSNKYMMNATSNRNLLSIDPKDWALILNFTAITTDGISMPPDVSATECALYFCVQTYNASVASGTFTERLIATDPTANYDPSALENAILTPETCHWNGSEYHAPYTGAIEQEHCTYNVSWLSPLALQNSLAPLMKGSGSRFISNRPDWSSETARAIYGSYGNVSEISSVFNSLASSLTTHARTKVCDARLHGVSWTNESYVRVRWLWMILPGALVLFTLIFFVATIFNTRKQFIWKSSPLALLFSNVAVGGANAHREFEMHPHLSKMEKTSEKIKARLELTANGVRLKALH